jgi:hypothetical protein
MERLEENISNVLITPQLSIPTANDAIGFVNRWLHDEVGVAVHVTTAAFEPETFHWHLPVELAYPNVGTLGVIGDIYLNAATCELFGPPSAEDLTKRALSLASANGIDE